MPKNKNNVHPKRISLQEYECAKEMLNNKCKEFTLAEIVEKLSSKMAISTAYNRMNIYYENKFFDLKPDLRGRDSITIYKPSRTGIMYATQTCKEYEYKDKFKKWCEEEDKKEGKT